MVHSRPIFFIFVFSIVQLVDKISPMPGFEPWISGIRSDRFSKWATTTAQWAADEEIPEKRENGKFKIWNWRAPILHILA